MTAMRRTCFIAVDIGATNLRVARFDHGVILSRSRHKTPHGHGPKAVVNAVVAMIRKVVPERTNVRGICVGVPAPVDPETGLIREASNLPELVGVCLPELLGAHFSAPVSVRNDAALAALGEHRYGAGRGAQDIVYFTISTGIGGGVIIGGRLVSGAGGHAGEMGELLVPNMSTDPRTPVSLEETASGSAIAAAAIRALNDGEDSVLREVASANPAAVTSRVVADAARGGDSMALRIMQTAATHIGFGVVDILHMLNPGCVVLGGGVMESADIMMPVIMYTVTHFAMKSSLRNVTIVRGTLGDDAGLYGAAAFLTEMTS